MTVPLHRDVNLLGVQDELAFGLAGEACVSFRLRADQDRKMCASSEHDLYVGSYSRMLSTLPSGYGMMIESEIVEPPETTFNSSDDLPEVIHEIHKERASLFRGRSRRIDTYAHLWTGTLNPLKMPLLPNLLPGAKRLKTLPQAVRELTGGINDITRTFQASLQSMQVSSERLTSEEIIRRYWDILSPSKATGTGPVVTGRYSLRSELCASNAIESTESFFMDGFYHAAVTLYDYPDELGLGSVDNLLEILPVGARYVQVVLVPEQEQYLSGLKRQHTRTEMLIGDSGTKDFESQARYKDLDEIITRCRQEGERIYVVWSGIILRSENEQELSEWKKKLIFSLKEIFGATALSEDLLHRRTFLASLPMNGHLSPRRNVMLGTTASALAPLSHPWRGTEEGMPLVGRSYEPLRFDLFDGGTPRHGIIVATTGGGKSFTGNILLLSSLSDPKARALVIDIGGSYRRLAEIVGGAYFDVRVEEKYAINPLLPRGSFLREDESFDPEMLAAQTSLLARFLPGGGSGNSRLVIEKALERMYRKKEEPILSDFYGELTNGDWEGTLQKTVDSVAAEFRQYVETVYANLLSRPSKVRPFEGPLTVFDLAGLKEHKNLQSILVAVIAFSLNRQLNDKGIRKVIIIDEGWELFGDEMAADLISKLYRQARKQNAAILSISQSPEEFLNSPVSPAIMANIHWIMALKMASGHSKLGAFGFTDQAIDESKTLQVVPRSFSEVLIRFGNAPARVARIAPTSLEYWIATTNANETVAELQMRTKNNLRPIDSVREMARKEPVISW